LIAPCFGGTATKTTAGRLKRVGSLLNINFAGLNKDALQALYWHHMLKHGFYLAQRVFITLTFMITQVHLDKFIHATVLFIDEHKNWLAPPSSLLNGKL
jgi:hypothetical protein